MTEPGTKLSRRYFANLLGLGAIAAAAGSTALGKIAEAVTEKVDDELKIVTEHIHATTRRLRAKWRVVVESDFHAVTYVPRFGVAFEEWTEITNEDGETDG